MRTITNIILAVLFITKINFPQQPNFLPLAIGNEYQTYNGIEYFFGRIEKDTVYPNGKTYYSLPRPIFEFEDTRIDTMGNIFTTIVPLTGTTGEPDEYMIFKADAQEGEIWPVAWDMGPVIDTLYAELLFTDTLFVFGQNRVIKSILLYENGIIPYVFWLADGIGQIREFYDDGTIVTLNYAKINGTIYGNLVGIDEESLYPISFTVSQNYPNPFNPLTMINYSIKEAGLVKVKVYDILGNEVAVLVNETKEAGYHSVEFNASNLPSGVYICTLLANGYSDSKKMLLIK